MDTLESKLMFSSKSDEWETPSELFRALDREFNFDLDVAATEENTKCRHFITAEMDALSDKTEWNGYRAWMNPPYSMTAQFLKRAVEETFDSTTTVALIPSRTDTRYWHEYVTQATEVRFLKGRLKFGGAGTKNSAPFPSAIIIFRARPTGGGVIGQTMWNWDWRG